MKTFQDSGFVLKALPAGELNKHIVLLLKEHGKVVVTAKGAMNPKSKLYAATQPFSCCEFKIYRGSGFLSLAEGNVLESFYNLSMDYDRYDTACHILKLVDTMIQPEMPARAALVLLYKGFKLLLEGKDCKLVRAVFELKIMQSEGYVPVVNACAECGDNEIALGNHSKDEKKFTDNIIFAATGLLCENCAANKRAAKISAKTLQAINYILDAKYKDSFAFSASDKIIEELSDAAMVMLNENIF